MDDCEKGATDSESGAVSVPVWSDCGQVHQEDEEVAELADMGSRDSGYYHVLQVCRRVQDYIRVKEDYSGWIICMGV